MSGRNVGVALVVGTLAVAAACGEPERGDAGAEDVGGPAATTAREPAWPRPNFVPGDDEAWVFFAVLGAFEGERGEFPGADYRSEGAGRGFEVRTFRGAQLEQLVDGWLAGPVGVELEATDPELLEAIGGATECLALDVRVPDAPHFDHVRSAIGLVTWFVDLGGVAVVDPQVLRVWRPADWRRDVFEAGAGAIHERVELFWSSEGDPGHTPHPVGRGSAEPPRRGSVWVRSRGLRRFARPDVSLRGVPAERFDETVRFLDGLVRCQIDGAVLPTGDEVQLPGHAAPVRCTRAGDLDDPDFINEHLRIEW